MHNVCECACMMCVSVHAMQVVDAREQLCKVNSLHLPLYVFIFFWVELSLYAYGTSALPTGKFSNLCCCYSFVHLFLPDKGLL